MMGKDEHRILNGMIEPWTEVGGRRSEGKTAGCVEEKCDFLVIWNMMKSLSLRPMNSIPQSGSQIAKRGRRVTTNA